MGEHSWSIAQILRDEIATFRHRISLQAVISDRWYLLGELQEIRHKLVKGLDALVVGICSSIAPVLLLNLPPIGRKPASKLPPDSVKMVTAARSVMPPADTVRPQIRSMM